MKIFCFLLNLILLSLAATSTCFAELAPGQVEMIRIEASNNTIDRLILQGKNLPTGDLIKVIRINYPIGKDLENDQWELRLENVDLSAEIRAALVGHSVPVKGTPNLIAAVTADVHSTNSSGINVPTLVLRVKIQSRFLAATPNSQSASLDITANDRVEFLFQRNLADADMKVLEDKARDRQLSTPLNPDDLPVPILRVSLVGYDGAANVLDSKATKLSVYLNQQRREELNQKFGIQFFVNNVSLNRDQILQKTIIYYRFSTDNPKQRFLKEALYLARIIPSESIIRPMVDQDKKSGVDIEILVGKDLN